MATPVERVHLAMAHAALPALLPTPPEWKMTPPCVFVLPKSLPKPKPSCADAEERWDARKNAMNKSPSSKPGRADAVDRWDAHMVIKPAVASPASSSGSGRRSSSSSCKSGSSTSRASSSERWDSNKRAISHASSSAERWDAQKKPRPMQAEELDDDDCNSSTGSNGMDLDKPQQQAIYAVPGFIASPEPSMLPFPAAFMVRAAA